MTTATVTLTDFLLARIAEDEQDAEKSFGIETGKGTWFDWILADCKAKREIVRGHRLGHCECRSVRILAAVYADHPDYREEWRP